MFQLLMKILKQRNLLDDLKLKRTLIAQKLK